MNALKLITRSAAFYWRTHLGVAAGAAVATAVLVGALLVGDSVRYSLRLLALRRLGNATVALSSPDRFFRAQPAAGASAAADLASEMQTDLSVPVAPAMLLDGSAATPDGAGRANQVQVVGVGGRFWSVGGAPDPLTGAPDDGAALNEHLARQLGVKFGDVVVLRVPVPSGLPREAPLSTDRDAVAALRVTVRAIVPDEHFGRFSLRANQLAPQSAFVPMAALQRAVKLPGKANVLLLGGAPGAGPSVAAANAALARHLRLPDAGLELRDLGGGVRELRTARVFLDDDVSRAAMGVDHALGVLAYFVDAVRLGGREAPYCILAGLDANAPNAPPSPVPPDLRDDEILLNAWLAEDLGAEPGQTVTLAYRTLGPLRTFEAHTATFRVRGVVPIAGPADDPNLMPEFPGLAGVSDCRLWRPGVAIDVAKLRDKDAAYWTRYKGTPKAFLTLRAAQKLWANRFGNMTAVRYKDAEPADALADKIARRIDPAKIGLYFLPVRNEALAASEPTSDFGRLFLGLSFFLIFAAVLLTGLLFVFGIEQRSRQVGLLLALGLTPRRVRRWMLAEGGLLAVVGAVIGAAAGLAYTRVVLDGLATVWHGAAASSTIHYHAKASSVAMGAGIGLVVALLAMRITLAIQGRATARELLSAAPEGRISAPAGRKQRWASMIVGGVCLGGAVAMALSVGADKGMAAAEAFFLAGGLVLLGTLAMCYAMLAQLGRPHQPHSLSLARLGLRSTGLRRWRSLTTIGLLACGVFLVAAVEVFRLDPHAEALLPTSGTGGFALYGESAMPILHDLNDPARRRQLAIDPNAIEGVRFVQLRVHRGDDASCLNLNHAQSPRVLGVQPGRLTGRFGFVGTLPGVSAPGSAGNPWNLLDANLPDGVVPAIGDADTLQWALHKDLGQDVTVTDDRGQAIRLRLVGKIGGSILQGSVLISDGNFRRLFPADSGYRAMLVDAPPGRAEPVRRDLMAAMEDAGLEVTTAPARLAMFAEVSNTYLSIFAALGGLGLVLGSVALGVVVMRNVLERRGELALLRAVGFAKSDLVWMVLCEHWALLGLGLTCGIVAAGIAVLPALRSPTTAVPVAAWLGAIGGVAVSGAVWTCLAAALALRGNLLTALRGE